ncbi:hypothetical protein AF72_06780 [Xylella taiwanensis]|uniref:Uncharacterized protein n=2 Tax=Xylella taiwanensis TaxID=1444770 RepID=Z9JKC2_9GAMM|nr:hypothetical protein AF72_06780 [Xylella taiwanensis]
MQTIDGWFMLPGFDGLPFSHWWVEPRDDGVVILSVDYQDVRLHLLSQSV